MAENTGISWTDHTANFWHGCVKVSPLCKFCYAERDSERRGHQIFGPNTRRNFVKCVWKDLPRWDKQARDRGKELKVFVMSMGDFFEKLSENHPDHDQMEMVRHQACHLMQKTTNLHYLLLTKRISNVKKMVPDSWLERWPRHIRLGVSVGTQRDADRDVPRLLEIPCHNFLSMEPLLEEVTIAKWLKSTYMTPEETWIEWAITGGESGSKNQPIRAGHPNWYRRLRDECITANTPFHFKQHGEWLPEDDNVRQRDQRGNPLYLIHSVEDTGFFTFPDETRMHRVGTKNSGRMLDGILWDEMPEEIACGS